MAAPFKADRGAERNTMVDTQIASRGIRDERLLRAMRIVPRERFVSDTLAEFAYEDAPLPIGEEQTISQPFIVASMIEAVEITEHDKVLEVGAGSGYAAAVISLIAKSVHAVERHDRLTMLARERFDAIGYGNIEVHTGDGTMGWPDAAPFDAILIAAAGPEVPAPLKEQLAIGGRLIMPLDIGGKADVQRLVKVVRNGESTYDHEILGAVSFVPLIGKHGWAEDGQRAATRHVPGQSRGHSLPEMIAAAAVELPDFDDPSFGRLFDAYADRRVVLLGEASHGTAEFYRARAAITRHLVEHHGYTIVAVEADWPDASVVDRYVRRRPARGAVGKPFQRFPTWMWRNTEVAALTQWMRSHNDGVPKPERRVGFYGLDIYNMGASIAAVLEYLDRVDPAAAATARERYGCLTPWQKDPATYGRAALTSGYAECEEAVIAQCKALLSKQLQYKQSDGDEFLDAAQNTRLVEAAERYYRVMYYGGASSWNLRDTHMFETLNHLLEAKAPAAKAIVWAHNSHIGDARFTDMGMTRGELNIGQLCRERYDAQTACIGFGTNDGTVAAAKEWDDDMEVMNVRSSRADSYERLFHDTGKTRCLLDLHDPRHDALRQRLMEPRLERYIGVIYRPETERWSHYSEASLPLQFDAYAWFDRTQAVTPLGREHASTDEHEHDAPSAAEMYPFGV
jgi:protein-L-isoaspartate(D-aspartate) O-methyltransferase